jgi:UDP-glucuronate 4-epimerase
VGGIFGTRGTNSPTSGFDQAMVTGAAGFIGSHLCQALLANGTEVIGVDSFNDNYAIEQKRDNLAQLLPSPRFRFVEGDLTKLVSAELALDLNRVDAVFHLAGEPGVRASWGPSFARYTHNNISATQALLEALKHRSDVRFVYASSSSIYGQAESFPTSELALPKPVSPYGVTKLAAEHLTNLYHANFGLSTTAVRYFTVFGPRQRPDMAFHIFCRAAITGAPITLYGDGLQTRDFTYVSDAVAGTIAAAEADVSGEVFNIGGGGSFSVRDVLDLIASLLGREPKIEQHGELKGDVRDTAADTSRAREVLGWTPAVGLAEGLANEFAWLQDSLAGTH